MACCNHCGELNGYPRIQEWRESAKLIESLGFTAVWCAEHHFFWDGWTNPVPTNPLLFGAFVAAQTTKLSLAQCGVCIPDWHPIRAAEDAAMLDHMSQGRLEFGSVARLEQPCERNFNATPIAAIRKSARRCTGRRSISFSSPGKESSSVTKVNSTNFRPRLAGRKNPRERLDPRFFTPEGELTRLQVVPTRTRSPGRRSG